MRVHFIGRQLTYPYAFEKWDETTEPGENSLKLRVNIQPLCRCPWKDLIQKNPVLTTEPPYNIVISSSQKIMEWMEFGY